MAEARLAASTMITCSIRASLIEPPSQAVWVWTMKTSEPRIDSSYFTWISPLAKSPMLAEANGTPSSWQMSSRLRVRWLLYASNLIHLTLFRRQ